MTVPEIMADLQAHGSESVKNIWLKHGIKEPFFGVKIEYIKTLEKKLKPNYPLALELYATGNADAMYLAGLITDDKKMTEADLQTWVKQAVSSNIYTYIVPWVAAGGNYGYKLALEWINSPDEYTAAAGWSTLANYVSLTPDDQLDMDSLKSLLARVSQTLQESENKVRSTMNTFVICVGAYVAPLTADAVATAAEIGKVTVDKHGTACKTPDAAIYITKTLARNPTSKKKKVVKC